MTPDERSLLLERAYYADGNIRQAAAKVRAASLQPAGYGEFTPINVRAKTEVATSAPLPDM